MRYAPIISRISRAGSRIDRPAPYFLPLKVSVLRRSTGQTFALPVFYSCEGGGFTRLCTVDEANTFAKNIKLEARAMEQFYRSFAA